MTTTSWRLIGVSVQGTSHIEKNIPCQDANAYHLAETGELLLAIADGAGSAERSHEGAQIAVEQALTSLETTLKGEAPNSDAGWQSLIKQAFSDALQAVVELTISGDMLLSAYATTLACVVVNDDWLAVGQIGDGAIVVESMEGVLFITTLPQRGEYANESYFLTMPDGLSHLAIYTTQLPIKSLILTTDGLLRLAFKLPEYEPSLQFFQPLLTFTSAIDCPEQAQSDLIAFLESSRVNSRTDDDKTLILATRVVETSTQSESPSSHERRGD